MIDNKIREILLNNIATDFDFDWDPEESTLTIRHDKYSTWAWKEACLFYDISEDTWKCSGDAFPIEAYNELIEMLNREYINKK